MSSPPARRAFGTRDLDEFNARLIELRSELLPQTPEGAYLAYTDGACLGNPEGPGGWAAAVEPIAGMPHGVTAPWLLWGHLSSTSNNRAEALGVLAAMEWVPPGTHLTIRSDSELTVRILQGRYKARANPDIWDLIRRTMADKRLTVKPEWVRGHAGDPGNELADRLSKLGASNGRATSSAGDFEGSSLAAGAGLADDSLPSELVALKPQGDWEREFVRSVARQLRGGRALSAKQQAIVDRIRARARDGS